MMNTILLKESEIKKLVSMRDIIEIVDKTFVDLGEGKTINPSKLNLNLGDSEPTNLPYKASLNAMPAYIAWQDMAGQKWAGGWGKGRREIGRPFINALIMLVHPNYGDFLAVMDGAWITNMRTGAQTAVILRYLLKDKKDITVGLYGAGVQGRTQTEALTAIFNVQKLYVYDPMFENIYTFQTQDLPTALAFAGDNRQFAAGCPYAEGGALGGTVYLMDTRKDEYVTIRNTEGMPVKIQYLTNAEVLVLYDTYAAVYDTADGTELYRYSYGGRTLQSAAISAGKNAVLLFGDGVHGALTQLTILDATLSEAGSADVNERASGVAASRTGAFVLTNDGVLSYGLDGVFYGATVTEAKPLAMVNGRKLLLLEQGEVSVFEPPAPPSASVG